MPNECKSASYTKLIYTIIEDVAELFNAQFDVSSYVSNQFHKDLFSRSKISCLLKRKNSFQSLNRLFLTICFDDSTNPISIDEISKTFQSNWRKSTTLQQLNLLGIDFLVEFFSKEQSKKLFNFFAFIINVNGKSSIECIFSLQSLTQKLIARDQEGEIIDFHTPLYQNINKFKKALAD